MRRRPLGSSSVTTIGAGDVSLAIAAARGVDAREVERTLSDAFNFGLTIVDIHDEPDAERLVGTIIRSLRLRDRVVIATRVPLVTPLPGTVHRNVLTERLPARYVQERVEAILRSTHLDALPLAQLPVRSEWRASSAWPELTGTCARLVREGKVMAWGLILDELDDDSLGFTTEPWIASLQTTFNLCDRKAEALLADIAKHERPLALLARQPLAGGALTGNLGPGVALKPRDDRNAIDLPTLEKIAVLAARLAPLVPTEPPAARSCPAAKAMREKTKRPEHLEAVTVAELALRFVIDRGAIALPRLHRHETVIDAITAGSADPMSADLLARILDERAPDPEKKPNPKR